MNLHLKMYNFLLLVSVESLINAYFVSLAQDTFDCSSNTTTAIRILLLLLLLLLLLFCNNFFYLLRIFITTHKKNI